MATDVRAQYEHEPPPEPVGTAQKAQSPSGDAGSLEPQEQLDLDESWSAAEGGADVNAGDSDRSDDSIPSPHQAKEPAPTRTPIRPGDDGVRVDPITASPTVRQPNREPQRTAPPPNQQVSDIAAFLTNADERRRAGQRVPSPRPIPDVLGAHNGSPIDQTRIQVLAAAAAARHLEGPESSSAQRLNKLAQDNDARLHALRDHERRNASIAHSAQEVSREDLDAVDQERIEREAVNDRRVFDAAAAVAMGYVALKGLPAYDQLAQLSETRLGPVPQLPAAESPEQSPAKGGPSAAEKTKSVLDSMGRGLAQAAGPLAGDDEVAANLSPVNLAQVGDELTNLVASIAPAMKAAMSSHPRSIKELLNVEQRPDEESEIAFEQEPELDRERGHDMEHAI
ncbi:MAG: hypothetical protein WAW17_16985 [Rhodococcus sp. (in: high G+C Gram-positive bacteria)]|uniref:hypothetical protein n=1 Tax=Rhodococcus sp. TaxID=1831 RepID=UPI003BB12D55